MVGVRGTLVRSPKLIVTLHAHRVVAVGGRAPLRPERLVRVVAVRAPHLRVATATGGVGEFDRIPGRHPRGEIGPFARMAATARPVDVLRPPTGNGGLAFDNHARTRRKKPGQSVAAGINVLPSSEMTRLTGYAERDGIVLGIPTDHRVLGTPGRSFLENLF